MSEITTPRDLFLHKLGDILYVEEHLEQDVLPQLMQEATNEELKKGLQKHLEQTRSHVENVEAAFEKLGEEPTREECIAFEGLKKEHEEIVGETAPELLDQVVLLSAAATEHYEISSYNSLVTMARALGEQDAIELFERNLRDDKETARQLESLAKTLTKEDAKALSGT
ncbi:MAG: ferritin-like domain-containing protein [Actinobacteria bacterium]|nr:ferritin-like domain-containing protein [Actinomycetota bacterium]